MTESRLTKLLIGSSSADEVEYKLFNVTCIIFVIWGAYDLIQIPLLRSPYTAYLELSYAVYIAVTLFSYLYSRLSHSHRNLVVLVWVLFFLVFGETWFIQAGSEGTIAFVMYPSMMIFLIITPGQRSRWFLVAGITCFVAALVIVSQIYPTLVTPYASAQDRFTDYITTVVLAFLVMGIGTVYYVGNYKRIAVALSLEKGKIQLLTDRLRKYLPAQLVDTLDQEQKAVVTGPQRIRITVFFSDIKDFTPQTDALQPEDLTRLLNEYLTEMTNIASKWGGTIDKFIGDAMMVFFGAPRSLGERKDASNCVQMAIEMQLRMRELTAKWFTAGFENPMQIRVGIHTGIAAVGDFGTPDRLSYTAIGGEVNVASRIQGIANPGGITITHPTWALINESTQCKQRGEKVSLKGLSREFTVYDIVF